MPSPQDIDSMAIHVLQRRLGDLQGKFDAIIEAAQKLSPSALPQLSDMASYEAHTNPAGHSYMTWTYPLGDAADFIREVLRALPSDGEWWHNAWYLADDQPVPKNAPSGRAAEGSE